MQQTIPSLLYVDSSRENFLHEKPHPQKKLVLKIPGSMTWWDGWIYCNAITDKKVVKFVVNTGTGKIAGQRQNGKINHCGKFSKM